MAFCSQCGSQLNDGAKFCASCGAPAGADAAAPKPSPQPSAESAPPPPARDAGVLHASPRPSPRAFPGQLPGSTPVTPGRSEASVFLPVIIGIGILIAAIVAGMLLWNQREGARPIASAPDRNGVTTDEADAAGETGTDTASGGRERTAPDSALDAANDAIARVRGEGVATSAAALDSAFYNDRVSAAARYSGPVRVSGVIATMVQPGPTPALSLEGRSRFNYMIVNFPVGYRTRLASLSKGMYITVDCASVTSLGGTTILNDCAV